MLYDNGRPVLQNKSKRNQPQLVVQFLSDYGIYAGGSQASFPEDFCSWLATKGFAKILGPVHVIAAPKFADIKFLRDVDEHKGGEQKRVGKPFADAMIARGLAEPVELAGIEKRK